MAETTLTVCTTCRVPDDAADDPARPRAGARLLAALLTEAERMGITGLRIEGAECLSVCKRPCTVALAAANRWTYVYGDLDPTASARVVLEGAVRYAGTADGLVPWRERPPEFRKGVVARIPPLASPFPPPPTGEAS